MAEAGRPSLVKLLAGAIFADEGILFQAEKNLRRRFGPIDFKSQAVPFNFTQYYAKEMGDNLWRCFFSFQRLILPGALADIKRYTNSLEKRLSRGHKGRGISFGQRRRINLDPGYISLAKLVLASCKDYAHRIYLKKGVYAEVTLHFENGHFQAYPWTYPDYQSQSYLQSFNQIRSLY
jgi:hypothetical protein